MEEERKFRIGDRVYIRFHRGDKPLVSSYGTPEEFVIIDYCGYNVSTTSGLSRPVYRIRNVLTGREHTADEEIIASREMVVAEKLMGVS